MKGFSAQPIFFTRSLGFSVVSWPLLGLFFLGFFVLASCSHQNNNHNNNNEPSNNNQKTQSESESSEQLIQSQTKNKIIYKNQVDREAIKKDCAQKSGQFKDCGSGCPEDAEICATVCVPVCILNKNQNQGATPLSGQNLTDVPLEIAQGFTIEVFANNLSGARDISPFDIQGNLWVSRTQQGIISLLEIDQDEHLANASDVFTGLNRPHGLAIDPQDGSVLYFAQTDGVYRVNLYVEDQPQKIANLPPGGRHFTRSLLFGPDNRLYVSIGSSCNVCVEENPKRAAIWSMKKDGSDFKPVATGLRNAVFMTINPIDGQIWSTEMGRDNLGDNLPPDEINIIKPGNDYGWPYCYGQNIRDRAFQSDQEVSCRNKTPSHVDLQAHVAPLGLDFIPEEGWPNDYGLDLLVAYHGSWNRSVPVGYKLKRIKLDNEGNLIGKEDFVIGWLSKDGEKLGRPVDIMNLPGGISFVSDDQRGVVYRVTNQNRD